MPTPIIMPKFSMTQEEGRVVTWLVEPGATVEKGDPLLEVETDKVNMEVEAPADGILGGILVSEGDVVPVTEIIAYILAPGEAAPAASPKVQPAPVQPQASTPQAEPPRSEPPVSVERPRATPVARRVAAAAGVDLAQVSGDGPKLRRSDVEAYLARRDGNGAADDGKVRATPAARRVSREAGLDLSAVSGSGPRGRVQEADALAAAEAQAEPEPAPAPVADRIPLTGMRRTIATRMQQSYQTVPHIMFTVEADMSAAEALRTRLNAGLAPDQPKISVTAILVKVCAWALLRHPYLNASLEGEEILFHDSANVGVAVALESGLIVPVIPQAETLGLQAVAAHLSDLSRRARENRLRPEDVLGGTFTISNLGMFGIDHFTAIINPPQAAILAVGRIARRQVVLPGDELAIRPVMQMTLSADHRVLDGALAARFLQDVVAGLEDPVLLLA